MKSYQTDCPCIVLHTGGPVYWSQGQNSAFVDWLFQGTVNVATAVGHVASFKYLMHTE